MNCTSGEFWIIFAPRQSGKTTFLKRMCRQLHADPTYVAVILCFEDYKNLDKTEFYSEIEADLYEQLISRLTEVHCEKTEAVEQFLNGHRLTSHISFRQLFEKLNRIIQFKKIVIFIDEFDGIPFKELENFLTSLRKLYIKTKDIEQKALYSVGLIGIRNITKLVVGGVSPFNIADQVDLPRFSLKNISDLYAQFTEETNQPFTTEAVKKVYEETAGQTWLVNRLGTILTVKVKPGTVEPIDEKDVEKAIQILLLERNDHFDNLYEKAGQFLLTAWLYQFVRGGEGELHYEVRSGLGRMDILLTYKGKKYIIETKVNRHYDLNGIIEEGILQLSSKYLASEKTTEGYLVIYDTKTPVGAVCEPQVHRAGDKKVTGITIGIGKPS